MILSEGIPAKEYNYRELILAAPAAGLVFLLAAVMRCYSRELAPDLSKIPSNAIVYAFHTDVLASFLADTFRQRLQASWIGYHGALSYIGSLGLALRHEPCFRYARKFGQPKPLQQILEFLATHQGRAYIRTDAGGPYNQTKASLYDLSVGSGRPLVAVMHSCNRKMTILHHHFPLPTAKISSHHSAPIYPEKLKTFESKSDAMQFIQHAIDSLDF